MADPGPLSATEVIHGQPCVRLRLENGDAALVALHGAQVLSWTAGGVERLYLSPKAVMDGQAAIRGGIPLCFPQFNQRGPLVKHGFARHLRWVPGPVRVEGPEIVAEFGLTHSEASLAVWPHAFAATLAVRLGAGRLQLEFSVHNTGGVALNFTLALHSYLRVGDIAGVRLDGLYGQPVWDSVADQRTQQAGPPRFAGEFDRVYQAAAGPLMLSDAAHKLRIAQSPNFGQTVVWNPGAAHCATLADMPPDGYRHMLCVEAAQIDARVDLAASARWAGWQSMTVAD